MALVSVTLYKDGRSWGGDCYELIFDSGHVSLQRVAGAQKPQAQYYFKPSAEVDIPRTGAQVQILADRKARHFALVIDGRLAGEWTDPESPMALGDGIMFQPIGNAAQVRLSKIKVTAWDGKTLVER